MIKQVLKSLVVAVMVLGPAMVWADASISAVAELSPTKGNTAHGEIKFVQKKGYVLVKAHVEGLTPGQHPFHVHEKGDCSAPDASSAGGHFNPNPAPVSGNAKPMDKADLGKLKANSKGVANYTFKDKHISLSGTDTIIGRGVVVHAADSPARVACGVIQEWHNNK